jgi:hypothetical protein
VRLLELEERRLRLQPERRGELVDTYQRLLQVSYREAQKADRPPYTHI